MNEPTRRLPRWLDRLYEPAINDIYLALVQAPRDLRAWLATASAPEPITKENRRNRR